MEQHDFQPREHNYFNHLLLQSDVRKLTKGGDFNPRNMQIRLEVNDIEVQIGDFNEVLKDWSNRIEQQIKERLDYMSKEKSVIENAEVLLKQKLGVAYEILDQIESDSWLLDDHEPDKPRARKFVLWPTSVWSGKYHRDGFRWFSWVWLDKDGRYYISREDVT